MRTYKSYSRDMTAAQVIDFVREVYPPETANLILARMGNGADYSDAVRAVTGHPVVETYSKQLINHIWYLQLHRVEGGCEILLHDSLHYLRGKPHPVSMGEFRLVERHVTLGDSTARIAEKVEIRSCINASPGFAPVETLTVVNPRRIFEYGTFRNLQSVTVARLAALTVPVKITRANVDDLLDRGQIEVHMKGGAWWAIRRNGKTQKWKSQPGRIRIPFKYGFKGCGAITTWDFVGEKGQRLQDDGAGPADAALDINEFRVKPGVSV